MSGDCGHGWMYHSNGPSSPCDLCELEYKKKVIYTQLQMDTALAQAKAEKCCNHEEEIARLKAECNNLYGQLEAEKCTHRKDNEYLIAERDALKREVQQRLDEMNLEAMRATRALQERDALNEAGEALHSKLREMTDDLRACVKALRECEPSMRKWAVLPIMKIQDALNRPTIRKLLSSE